MTDQTKVAPETPVRLTKATPVELGTSTVDTRQTQVATELDAARKAKADARKAKADAKKAEPTPEEVVFVAKAMDFDSHLDWTRPERCENARVEAKRMIVAHRACLRLSEVVKAPVAEGAAVPLTKAMKAPGAASGVAVPLTRATPPVRPVGPAVPQYAGMPGKPVVTPDYNSPPYPVEPTPVNPVAPLRVEPVAAPFVPTRDAPTWEPVR